MLLLVGKVKWDSLEAFGLRVGWMFATRWKYVCYALPWPRCWFDGFALIVGRDVATCLAICETRSMALRYTSD
jgi:hypothetical protein